MSEPPRKKVDMAYTVDVVIASALARGDFDASVRASARRFEFRLLAAASEPEPGLPLAGWHDLRRLLKLEIGVIHQELRLSLQAEGYAALQRVARRSARLYSPDGRIDLRLSFDSVGRALAVLADTAEIRAALTHVYVLVEERAEPPDPPGPPRESGLR